MQPNTPFIPLSYDVHDWKAFFERDETDLFVFNAVTALRKEVESEKKWKSIKLKANKEFEAISPEVLSSLFDRFLPFIRIMPAGHGIGHLTRDLIHLLSMLHDPTLYKENRIEMLVGLISGTFHDIGNSVVERYAESYRFTGHAEVGAFLFGAVARDLIPPWTLKLIQFSIAAHTNYLQDLTITKYKGTPKELTKVRKPYASAPMYAHGATQKISCWLAQGTDRLDALGVPIVARYILTKAVPTADYSAGQFHKLAPSEEKDFIHHFTPMLRTKEYKKSLPKGFETTAVVLEHFYSFYETAISMSPYSKYDTPYFLTRLVEPLALDQARFIIACSAVPPKFTLKERTERFTRFFRFCKLIEPAQNTDATLALLKKKFLLLSEDTQNHWAYAFEVLTNTLYPSWFATMQKLVAFSPSHKDPKIHYMIQLLYKKIKLVINGFDPSFLDTENYPDLYAALGKLG